jgi:hypothetical protein
VAGLKDLPTSFFERVELFTQVLITASAVPPLAISENGDVLKNRLLGYES